MNAAAVVRPVPAVVGIAGTARFLWLVVVALAVALVPGSIVVTLAAQPAAPPLTAALGVYGLPLPAQALISQTLGEGDTAYHLDGLAARNPVQRLTADFASSGVTVRAGAERLGLSVVGLPAAVPVATANRVEYRRGSVTEWYANGPLGIEQGFTLERPLGSPLRVALSGTLTPALEGRTVILSASGEPVLRLRGLYAQDADGRILPSRFGLDGRTLLLRVDDRGASYPITVDPFFERAKLTGSDVDTDDGLGVSVAIAGDTVVVGAHNASVKGAAYVFVRAGSMWNQQAKLTASDAAPNDFFGYSVAVAGDTAVVGALADDTAAGSSAGSAYVFVRSGTVWSEQAKLTASDGAPDNWFGNFVAVAGDTAVVGAPLHNGFTGAAYVFVRSGTVWSQQAKLTASDAATGDELGWSVALAGDTAVLGAQFDDTTGGVNSGSAYVFVRSGSVWAEQAKLTASDGAGDDSFGWSVAVAGDTAVAGAPLDATGAGTDAGSAYVFVRSGSVWSEQAKLTASDAAPGDRFGYAVAVADDTAVVGAELADTPAGANAGSAYLFVRSGSSWTEDTKLTASDGSPDDQFGFSVAVAGETAVVGARFDDTAAGVDAGSAYVFKESPCTRTGATLSVELDSDETVTISRSVDAILADGSPCDGASVLNIDAIDIVGAGGLEALTVDLSEGPFAPGVTAEGSGLSEIEWSTRSIETLIVRGSIGTDTIRFGSAGGNLNADDDADLTLRDVLEVTVYGDARRDVLSGLGASGADPGKWLTPLRLYGEGGDDKLTGGLGDDLLDGGPGIDDLGQIKVADGADVLVGGAGVDQVSYATRAAGDPLSVTLDGLANDGSAGEGDNVGSDVENVLLGKGDDFFDGSALAFRNLVQGGAGADELHGGGSGDQLRGDGGNDLLFGDGGNDVLNAVEAEAGTSDTLSGGSGTDTCRVDDADVITDC